MSQPLLDVRVLSRSFPGVRALDGASLRLEAGEVLAVVGENGAGKSTLMKILAGVQAPDAGEILLDGQPVWFNGVRDALRRGIVLIHQELNLAGNLSVSANLFLGRERTFAGPLALLDDHSMRTDARALLSRVGLAVDPDALVGELPIGRQQLVEIARALAQSARLIIMDEPTSSLSQHETETLFRVIDDLKRSGVAILYISHRLAEVRRVADRVTVLRDGRNAGELARDEIHHAAIVRLMVGRDLKPGSERHAPSQAKAPRLDVRDLCFAGGADTPISLTVGSGEIVGLAGLVGAGRTEFAEALFGLRTVRSGTIRIDGRDVPIRSPREAIRAGLLLAPEDRRLHGLIVADSVQCNCSLPNLDRVSTAMLVRPRAEAALASDVVDRLHVKTPRLTQPVGLLSGGNQQKVVFGKWLTRSPRVLVLDEPTRGVDVGARAEIYALMHDLAASGVAILMISSDLEEVLSQSDRVVVMHQGRIAGELPREALSEEAVMDLATGGGH